MSDTYPTPPHGWTCFHCGEHFRPDQVNTARSHFGADPCAQPGCLLRLDKDERGQLRALRAAESQLERYRQEDTDLHRNIARMESEHSQALRAEEEKGYDRGLRDARLDMAGDCHGF